MAVTLEDVRHIAALARLGVDDRGARELVAELNGILAHMDTLQKVDTATVPEAEGVGAAGTWLRADAGPPIPLARSPEGFAPLVRDGFFLVPRLSTHDEAGTREGPQ